ncbi:LEAF RUST 10 DISEASE-RESISTANCE LOCUS RECEPTOR-LIKE PROTEIN KINASE-like 2.3 [Carya illinoinensis]|uniref:Protein kinase domain-containing protein n=1 Tax=Carya illinoinensis TaxID=32201 RepID=A0A8T1P2R7_CARIL|nr:LEAF RUST 10 DISEASE-RESISTANCE LOCUS RECEPTOR-LIKE PROTEIN KINASE-like 2.3 [Carya illinoinensis]KAG6635663.1 hypothetical protein CIPAW_11G058700 [Carya illinoinensis]
MAREMSFPAAVLTALSVLLLLHQTFSVKDIHLADAGCSPSSCCNIQNISYPFRLMEDPPNCGDPRYNLSCENNITVLYIYGGRYYVREINYRDYTIRIVDSGIQRDHFSSIPRFFLYDIHRNHSPHFSTPTGTYWHHSKPESLPTTMVFLSCEKQVNSPSYWNVSSTNCFTNGVYSSNSTSSSQMHRYVAYDLTLYPEEVEESCRIEQISLIISTEALQYTNCYLDDANKIQCFNDTTGSSSGFFKRLEGAYNDVASPKKLILLVFYHGLLYLIAKMVMGTPFVLAFLIYKWRMRHLSMYDAIEDFLQSHNNLAPIRYSYPQIRKMSKNFKDKLGEGGYGTVFKGTLRSGQLVAIKILTKSKANGQDFISEVATIGRIHHVNVVQLIGFCVEGSKRALVYEFMSNGSLNNHIFMNEGSILIRYKKMHEIALGVARGIEYLHQGCDIRILHFDIKPHNILLDENLNPKLSDFGLAKSYPIADSIVSLTAARGTFGYMAPEFFYKNIGGISYKADVYSFGMLLMEMAGRRKNLNAYAEHSSQIYFPTWVYDQLHDGNDIEMEEYATKEEEEICKLMIIVALWCIQMEPSDRPSMNKVVEMLEGEVKSLQLPPKPFFSLLEQQIEHNVEISNQDCLPMHSNESSQSSTQS